MVFKLNMTSAVSGQCLDFLKALSNIIFPLYSLCYVAFGSLLTSSLDVTTSPLKEVDLWQVSKQCLTNNIELAC